MQYSKTGLLYLFCIAREKPSVEISEIPLLYFKVGNVYPVFTKVSQNDYEEENLKKNLEDMEWIKSEVNLHERIIERIMLNNCVVPSKFATLFRSEESLRNMITENMHSINEDLENLSGKEEWGVKAFCNLSQFQEAVLNEGEERKEEVSISPGKAFLLRKKKEQMQTKIFENSIYEYEDKIFAELGQLAVERKRNNPLPKSITELDDEMLFNGVFLVAQNKVEEFIKATDQLNNDLRDKGIHLSCTGPWPPYNFCGAKK